MDKNEVIKKHILKYIFSCEKCEFINDPKVTLYNRVSKEIEKELGIILLNTSEFYNIFNMLVDNKTIEITYDESEQAMKNGVLKLYDSIEVRNYLLKNNYIGLKEAFEYVDKRYLDSQKMFSEQLARMENAER